MSKKIFEHAIEDTNEIELYTLPKSWLWARITTAGAFTKNAIVDGPFGSNLKISDYVENGPIPVLTTRNLNGSLDGVRYISEKKFRDLERSAVRPNDILMAKIGSCGKVGIYPSDGPEAIIPANLLKVTVNRYFALRYVYYFFTSAFFQKALKTIIKATAQPAFGVTNFKQLPFPIAPSNEQRRIVSKIDELFSEIEEGERALERAQKLVKRYRQSVLKAAVTGELTREWREKHKGKLESGEDLFARILKARREAWEKSELDKMKAKGQTPSNDDKWKNKYKEPAAPDCSNLPELPEGWVWASLEQLAWSSSYGTSEKCDRDGTGVAVLRIPNVRAGQFDYADIKNAKSDLAIDDSDCLAEGDLLVIRTNGSEDIIGLGSVLLEQAPFRSYFASYLIRFRLILPIELAEWINFCWQSHLVREFVNENRATSAGQYNVSQSSLMELLLPVPSSDERREIVNELSRIYSRSENIAKSLDDQTQLASALRQSILKSAFSGQLVPPDPTDEPASVLLERIAAERKQQTPKAATKPANRKSKKAHA